jgi:hypothetical protein
MYLRNSLLIVFATLTLVAVLPGCTLTRAAWVYTHSPENLPKVSPTLPIYAEKGAESMAGAISAALPTSIQHIEATYGGKLDSLPPIVVCATEACYTHYAAIPSSAAEALRDKRISINGAKIFKEKRDAVQLFTHELSHFYWSSQGVDFQPRWFEEGMAVGVSNGGGAEDVSVQAAERAIRSGTTIHPTLNSGFWNYLTQPLSPPQNNWQMYYRQAGMFVQYLHDSDPIAFTHLLEALKNTKDLQQAWSIAYKNNLDEMWLQFVKEIQGKATEQNTQKS